MKPQKRSVSINGHRTSISLEPAFWEALREVAAERGLSIAQLIADIDLARISGGTPGNPASTDATLRGPQSGLSGAIRVYLLDHYRSQS